MRFFLLFVTLCSLSFGVVSIAPVAIGAKAGTSGQVNASFQTQRGNTESDAYSGGAKLQYDDNTSYVTWGELSVNYAEASGVKNSNATYAHLRYIHTFNGIKNINWEVFTQSETNQFTSIQERFVTGGGMRFHIKDDELGALYLGTGAFHEYIDYSTAVDATENNLRGNFYLAYNKTFSKDSSLSYVGYYQPKLNELYDYLLSNGLELQVFVYEKVYLSFKLSYLVDTKPAVGIKQEDFSQTTSFVYKF